MPYGILSCYAGFRITDFAMKILYGMTNLCLFTRLLQFYTRLLVLYQYLTLVAQGKQTYRHPTSIKTDEANHRTSRLRLSQHEPPPARHAAGLSIGSLLPE